MPFDTPSLPVLVNRTQSDLAGDALRRSDAQVLARAVSGAAYGLYGYLDWIVDQILPDTADEVTLERMADLRLKQPRKAAQPAEGRAGFTAAANAVVDVGTVLQADDGRSYKVTAGKTTVAGTNTVAVEAVDAGVMGNADPGLILTLVQPIEGVAVTFTVLAPGLTGGIAQESVELLRERVSRSYRVLPHGGNNDDYETWALECPGVTRAWSRRKYMGPGTVGVFIMRDGDPNPIPSAAQLAEVYDYIEAVRPVTAELYVIAPVPKPVQYRIRLTPDTGVARAAVETQLMDLHSRECGLGDTLLLTHIAEAISSSAGETDHKLMAPVADVAANPNQLLTYGSCVWLA